MPQWVTVECERALYVDFGINVVACDRLPSGPVTLILKGMVVKHGALTVQKFHSDEAARLATQVEMRSRIVAYVKRIGVACREDRDLRMFAIMMDKLAGEIETIEPQ